MTFACLNNFAPNQRRKKFGVTKNKIFYRSSRGAILFQR
ncbi:unnamed protein product [Paramecium octaurelia]|uniref:Uncharacterized protein n=1 Tax=Paramecium octaurelia TaxID=43137 RepID=A0A8S1TYX3_PAROT|nr:unnamed protein product [Paramecium octaurelia]